MSRLSPENKAVLVMGVGRSGTTSIYSLLQLIFEQYFPGDVDYVYEPFLWNRSAFNKLYTQLRDEFSFSESLSISGRYHHQRLPLIMTESYSADTDSETWLSKTLLPEHGRAHYLGKMIRANGRIPLIRKLAPSHKIIFMIRNPIDVINSAIQLFSFYGTEFHRSDFPRFKKEVFQVTGQNYSSPSLHLESVAKEYFYWYYSNLAFLEYAQANPHSILTLSYEAFKMDRASIIQEICKFIEVDYKPGFLSLAKKPVGAIKSTVTALNLNEYDFLFEKLHEYEELLHRVNIKPDNSIVDLIKLARERGNSSEKISRPLFNGYYASKELVKVEASLAESDEKLNHALLFIEQLQNMKRHVLINKLLYPLDWMRKRLPGKDR